MLDKQNRIALFEWKQIRKIWHNNEWWFVVSDVVNALVESKDIKSYISKLKKRDEELSKGWGQIVHPLPIPTKWWVQKINCANTEGIFRIIQSIPSPKAEPFKKWLAKVWYDRIKEIEDPELAMQRMIETYKKKWYPEQWIDVRVRWIQVRNELTDTWKYKWAKGKDYAILTDEIYKAFSWMTNKEWKDYKWIDKWNLRDGMEPMELILTMLAEQSTKEITQVRDIEWLDDLKKASKDGGSVAQKARNELIEKTWKDPITNKNYLEEVKKLSNKDTDNSPQ